MTCSWVGDLNGLTHVHWGKWLLPVPQLFGLDWHVLVPARCSDLMHRAGFYQSGRAMMAQDPLHGDARGSYGISVEDEAVTQKSKCRLALPFHTLIVMNLQSLEWREVGLSLSWLAISYKLQQWDQYLSHQNDNVDSHIPLVILHWTFHPWFKVDILVTVPRIAQSFLFIQPRGVSLVCCWASSRQSTLGGTFSVSLLSGVCSSRAVVAHPTWSAHMTIQRGVPLEWVMRKSQFWCRTQEHSVCWFFTRYEATLSVTWHSTSYGSSSYQSFTFHFPL